MDVMQLLNRLIRVDPDHFVWPTMTTGGVVQDDSPFTLLYSGGVTVTQIMRSETSEDNDPLEESGLVYGLMRVAADQGMRTLVWEEETPHGKRFFARVWKPNGTPHSPREVKAPSLFQALCLAYLSNFEAENIG